MTKSRRIISESTKDFPQLVYDYIKGKVSAEDVLAQSVVDKIIENPNRVKSIFEIKMDGNELIDNFDLQEYDNWYLYEFLDERIMEYETEDISFDRFGEGDYFLGNFFHKYSTEYQMSLQLYRKFDEDFNAGSNPQIINNSLLKGYRSEIDEIFDVNYEYENEEFTKKMRGLISEQLKKVLSPYRVDIQLVKGYSDLFNVSIPAGNLYYLMKMYHNKEGGFIDLDSIHSAMRGMVRGNNFGGWSEDKWNLEINEYFTNPSYVSETNLIMKDLVEKIEGEITPKESKLLSKIFNEFGNKRNIVVPQKKLRFMISNYDPPSNKLNLFVQNLYVGDYENIPLGRWSANTKEIKISPENFYNWYYNYELTLESRNILLSLGKILSHDSQ
jgi:hypothetical protein